MFIHFTKMHSLGNDFVLIDAITQNIRLRTHHIQRIADRHFGIGCDQVLLIEPPIRKTGNFYLRIFNANGNEVEQCGNGARCAARFFYEMGFSESKTLAADCLKGPLQLTLEENGFVTADMGLPRFNPTDVPFVTDKPAEQYPILIEQTEYLMSVLSIGNPHAVIFVKDVKKAPVETVGRAISEHSAFPHQTNVGFAQILNPNRIALRVFERDVGETLACGSGACAAVVSGIRLGLLQSPVAVIFKKGEVTVTYKNDNQSSVTLHGGTQKVFKGVFLVSDNRTNA